MTTDQQRDQDSIQITNRYGETTVTPEQIYYFPKNIVGFSEISQYALIPFEQSELYLLQALTDEISFILIPASLAEVGTSFELDDQTAALLELNASEEAHTFLIVNMIDDNPYVNPKAPIVLVPSTRKGCQYIIPDFSVPVRQPLLLKGDS